jgi:hypothetical protein
MHRRRALPIPAGYLRNRRAIFQDFQHSAIPLLHDTQLHLHTRPLSLRSASDRSQAPGTPENRQPVRSVAHRPELPSATYRNRVRNLSTSNQNQGVKHLPGSHTSVPQVSQTHTLRLAGVWILEFQNVRRSLNAATRLGS